MITVIDYGMGNLRSVVKAVEKYTSSVRIARDPSSIETSSALIMPGDGAFGKAMENLGEGGWVKKIQDFISKGGYFFGICLGFQLLFSSSEEFGSHEGLGLIPGKVVRFDDREMKVPHMGWNDVTLSSDNGVLEGVADRSHFYFIHSFFPQGVPKDWTVGTVEYGVTFPCIVGRGNLIATQFHPEKSHHVGLRMIENFVRMACS